MIAYVQESYKPSLTEALECHTWTAGPMLFDFARESSISEGCFMRQLSEAMWGLQKETEGPDRVEEETQDSYRNDCDLLAESASRLMQVKPLFVCGGGGVVGSGVHIEPRNL